MCMYTEVGWPIRNYIYQDFICSMFCSKIFIYIKLFSIYNNVKYNLLMLFLHMRKLRLREIKLH